MAQNPTPEKPGATGFAGWILVAGIIVFAACVIVPMFVAVKIDLSKEAIGVLITLVVLVGERYFGK